MLYEEECCQSIPIDPSIGICCYNEEANIAKLLDNLLTKQHLPRNAEILVVCSGSNDKTSTIVNQYCKLDKRITLIVEKDRKGKAEAVNRILSIYKNDFLILIPGDVIPSESSIAYLIEAMISNPRIGVICGQPVPVNNRKGFMGYIGHMIWRLHHRTLLLLNDLNLSTHATGELMALRKGIVDKIPTNVINEDAYLAVCASSKNLLVKYNPKAVVHIKTPTTIVDYINQRRRIIFGHHRVKQFTNQYPSNLESMLFSTPLRTLNILLDEIKEQPKHIPKFLLAVFLELLINALAIKDLLLRKEHTLWKVAHSTKNLVSQ